ncbi:sin3 histone deacetylase corepressor complex component SDS3-like isoform X1 [Artemia franciscana]|uniref:sin3 histone deacetylase corepressor complex component SDS3-like isoform X1 n=1 Tax=Artemia franciscana TaxID=6661 RepID=UPI0032DBCDDE
MIENEHLTIELMGDSMEKVKPVITRKLRRRPNEPLPIAEKRQKTAPTKLNTLMDEGEAAEDLKAIQKGKPPLMQYQNKKNGGTPTSTPSSASPRNVEVEPPEFSPSITENIYEARIEDGKLFFEKRWYYRGQAVTVDGENSRFPCVISAIGSDSVWMRRMSDNTKTRISISQLAAGKFYIQRRAA